MMMISCPCHHLSLLVKGLLSMPSCPLSPSQCLWHPGSQAVPPHTRICCSSPNSLGVIFHLKIHILAVFRHYHLIYSFYLYFFLLEILPVEYCAVHSGFQVLYYFLRVCMSLFPCTAFTLVNPSCTLSV